MLFLKAMFPERFPGALLMTLDLDALRRQTAKDVIAVNDGYTSSHSLRSRLVESVKDRNFLCDEIKRLRTALNHERLQTASKLRDIATRIGTAAWPEWVRNELNGCAQQLEFWARDDLTPPSPS